MGLDAGLSRGCGLRTCRALGASGIFALGLGGDIEGSLDGMFRCSFATASKSHCLLSSNARHICRSSIPTC